MHTLRVLLTSLCCLVIMVALGVITAALLWLDHLLQRRTAALEHRAQAPAVPALPAPRGPVVVQVPTEFRATIERGTHDGPRPFVQPR